MADEGKITMNEFKTVVESFRSEIKAVVEVVNHRFDRNDERMDRMEGDIASIKHEVVVLHEGQTALKEQGALLHEGQNAIRSDLRHKADYTEIEDLQKRVTRLENKVA